MRLENELKAVGSDVSADTFEETLTDVYSNTNRDCAVDSFLCRPWEHREFCAIVRMRLGLDETCDEMILRRLLNLRKNSGSFAMDERPQRSSLPEELAAIGAAIDPGEFREKVSAVFKSLYRQLTVDRLLMQWRDALHFCAIVRHECRIANSLTANNLILRTLLNNRRRGELSLRDRVAAN